MRRYGRRAAIGATTVALVLAAAGSSLAAVRATRYEGGLASSGLALPAPHATGPQADRGAAALLDPTAGASSTEAPAPQAPAAGGPPVGSAPSGPAAVSPPSSPSAPSAAGPPPVADQTGTGRAIEPLPGAVLGPVSGPTPTTTKPSHPASLDCPGDGGLGALAHAVGGLRAVDYQLPWPGTGPLVLVPQSSATRGSGVTAKIVESSVGGLAADGSSLSVTASVPASIQYSLVAGNETARGTIAFTPTGVRAGLDLLACRDRPFTLYDVAGASVGGSPLRIVGVVAPTASVTVDSDGGTALFRSNAPGIHSVTLLTANDLGVAGPVVTATVTVP